MGNNQPVMFDVGETVTLLSPHVGVPVPVQYRGRIDHLAVVILNGMQMTVQAAWLSRAKEMPDAPR